MKFSGNELWGNIIPLEMEQKFYNSKTYYTYANLQTNLYNALKDSAMMYPDKTAILDNYNHVYTFSDFLRMVDEFSYYLKYNIGIQRGNHVGILLYNSVEFCVSFLSLIKIGAVTVPLPSKFKQQEVFSLIEKSDLDSIITNEDFKGWFSSLSEKDIKLVVSTGKETDYGFSHLLTGTYPLEESDAQEADPALLMFTSGTTSTSKGVILTHFNIMHAVVTYKKTLDISDKDSSIIATPIYHVTGLVAVLGLFLYCGGTIHIHKFFNANSVLSSVKEHNITFIHASPTVFSLLLQESNNFPYLPSLKAFACGAANMPKEKIKDLHTWLPKTAFRTVYGLTETSSPATVFPSDAAVSEYIGSSGFPVPGTVFKIVDDNKNELPFNNIGEVAIKGSVVLSEYYKLNIPQLSADGWLFTGDLGYFNEDGYVFLVDRKKDMINRGGEKICSYDIENELYKLPGILEAAVVGIKDNLYGEVAVAVVKCSSECEYTEGKIQEFLSTRMAKYKIPAKILFLNEIPVNPNTKVDKKAIRKLFE